MTTLKELIKDQEFTGVSDISVIKTFFDVNDLDVEGIGLINELTKQKIAKMKHKEYIVKEWSSHLPSEYLYETYDLKTADKLHRLELDYISNGCELSDVRLEWAKENLPNIDMPDVYFQPLINYLDSCGIRFKGEKPLEHPLRMKLL